jgi:hypothetical protein
VEALAVLRQLGRDADRLVAVVLVEDRDLPPVSLIVFVNAPGSMMSPPRSRFPKTAA